MRGGVRGKVSTYVRWYAIVICELSDESFVSFVFYNLKVSLVNIQHGTRDHSFYCRIDRNPIINTSQPTTTQNE
jgi:hypothetical protein